MPVMAAFIIHLERATSRSAQVSALQAALPMPVTVLKAVDARSAGAELGRHYDRTVGWKPPYPFLLSDAEIAVFMSHRKAWREIVDSGLEAGLIVEDDVALDPGRFPEALALAQANLTPGRWIRFPWEGKEEPGAVVSERGSARLMRPPKLALGMLAQLVHRDAALRMLEATEVFDRPVDTALQLTWMTGIDVLCVAPSGVSEISVDLGGSTLQKRRGTRARLYAEFARALYRQRVGAMARRN